MVPRHRSSILMVGYGFRGRQWERALRRSSDMHLEGIVDVIPSDGRRSVPSWQSLQECLANDRWNAAVIATPPQDHVPSAIACLQAGVGVLIEKPLAPSVAEAQELLEVATSCTAPALVAQNFRYLRRERAIAKILADSGIGDVRGGVITSARKSTRDRRAAGPSLWNYCLHHLDALRHRYGASPSEITAFRQRDDPESESLTCILQWTKGPRVVYHHTEGAPCYHYHEWIEGTEGGIAVEHKRVTLFLKGRRGRRVSVRPAASPERFLLDELAAALAGEPDPAFGLEDNVHTLELVEAVAAAASA